MKREKRKGKEWKGKRVTMEDTQSTRGWRVSQIYRKGGRGDRRVVSVQTAGGQSIYII